MKLFIDNTKGWCEKQYLGIGRAYDDAGDLDTIYIDFIVWRIGVWLK